jgi:glycosyltransferase involved in cell wall biosynthesis
MIPNNFLFDATPLDMDTSKRGIGSYVFTLLNYLEKGNSNFVSLRFRKSNLLSSRELVFPLGNLSERYLWAANASYLPRFVRKNKIDLFHSTHPYTTIYSKKYKTVATVHDLIPLIFYKEILGEKWYNAKLSYQYYLNNLKKVSHIIAVSHTTKDDCIKLLGINEDKITVVYEAVDNNRFFKISDSERLNKVIAKYVLPDKFFLYVGGLDFRKNYERMLNAFINISEKIPEHLVMVGAWGTNINLLKHNKVHYLNFVSVEDLVSLYSLATGLIFPSLYEGFGIPVLEAFNCECAVLCSNNSSLAEIAGNAALLVDPYSVGDIARGIERLSCDQSFRKELVESGLIRAKCFSLEKMYKETFDVYDWVY